MVSIARGSSSTVTVVAFFASSATPGMLPGFSLAITWLSLISTLPTILLSLA